MEKLVIFALCCITAALANNATDEKVNSVLRLTNNVLANPGEFPYQVSIQINGVHHCGGSLISARHVLTAAHCVYKFYQNNRPYREMEVVVGTISLNGGVRHVIDRITYHRSYTDLTISPNMVADISVIRLKYPVQKTAYVDIIGLPNPMEEINTNTRLIVSGFGANFAHGPNSWVLKKMWMYVVDRNVCQKDWSFKIQPSQICASVSPRNGACHGDSGGALTWDRKTIYGVVSAGSTIGCGTGIPDLFTKVSYFMDYIRYEMSLY